MATGQCYLRKVHLDVTHRSILIFAPLVCYQSGRNQLVLQQTYYMAERAVGLDNTSADYLTELGYQLVMMNKVREAMKCYRNAMKMDETSVKALTGGY